MKPQMNRRDFLKCSAMAAPALWLGACMPQTVTATEGNYYLKNKEVILDDCDPYLKALRKELNTGLGAIASTIIERTRQRFADSLGTLPDIGGDANTLTATFYQAALALSFYQTCKEGGISVTESGRMAYCAMRSLILQPELMGGADVKMANSISAREFYRRMAAQSQLRTYPDDWVFEYIEGDGIAFDYGVDYKECAICKLYAAHHAQDLAPYLCLGDYPISQVYNTGLIRTRSLASGGSLCDFRFKSGREPQIEWMPEFLLKG